MKSFNNFLSILSIFLVLVTMNLVMVESASHSLIDPQFPVWRKIIVCILLTMSAATSLTIVAKAAFDISDQK